ncbi:hypothetical protein ILUMI_27208 [Ignelater luminosus]|uniref:Uncharacterized protein n=1 Tax=Ignelater luminosus TaxID=2038154 RepID=A0A8K0C398_IGNLU|nr:hypothetical protein ILUMI_27208 [Ignelater luminosus]
MEIVKGFFDYCVSEKCATSGNFEEVAKRLLQLGYRTIAINQIVDENNLEPKKKKKKGEIRDVVPVPLQVKMIEGCEKLRVLNRLTIIFSNQEIINKILKSPNYRKYNVVAVQPISQAALQFTCSSIDADIFSYDPETKPNFKLNRKLYNQLVERGFYFELLYSPAIQASSQRKNVIAMSHFYHSYGKSRNIIISSGATSTFLLRSPYDVVNLGFLFGLSEEQSKNAIGNFGKNVYIHGVGRRHGKSIILVEDIASSEGLEQDDEMELDQPAHKRCKQ